MFYDILAVVSFTIVFKLTAPSVTVEKLVQLNDRNSVACHQHVCFSFTQFHFTEMMPAEI